MAVDPNDKRGKLWIGLWWYPIFIVAAALLILLGRCTAEAMPDKKLTPGAIRIHSKATICSIRWGRDERHVTQSMKVRVCKAYGAKNCPGKAWELDHLLSRELGGADVETNLWPQPHPEFHKKDRLENKLHRMVCGGEMSLRAAQQCLVKDWWACYQKVYPEEFKRAK